VTTCNQILLGDQTTGSTTSLALAEIICDTSAEAQSVCRARLLVIFLVKRMC